MDPATLFAISSTAVRTILALSRYVDEVRNASTEVQELSAQVSSTHLIISQLKVIIAKPEAATYMNDWESTFEPLLIHCHTTLKQIEDAVIKAKVKEKCSSAGQVLKRMKWTFKQDEVDKLSKNLEVHKDNLDRMLQVLSRSISFTSLTSITCTVLSSMMQV